MSAYVDPSLAADGFNYTHLAVIVGGLNAVRINAVISDHLVTHVANLRNLQGKFNISLNTSRSTPAFAPSPPISLQIV